MYETYCIHHGTEFVNSVALAQDFHTGPRYSINIATNHTWTVLFPVYIYIINKISMIVFKIMLKKELLQGVFCWI